MNDNKELTFEDLSDDLDSLSNKMSEIVEETNPHVDELGDEVWNKINKPADPIYKKVIDGTYDATFAGSEIKSFESKGYKYTNIQLTFKILDGEFKGSRVWDSTMIYTTNERIDVESFKKGAETKLEKLIPDFKSNIEYRNLMERLKENGAFNKLYEIELKTDAINDKTPIDKVTGLPKPNQKVSFRVK